MARKRTHDDLSATGTQPTDLDICERGVTLEHVYVYTHLSLHLADEIC
jgi:hypothetical protein